MLFGIPPFYSDDIDRIYELIKYADLRFPKKITTSNDAKDLIMKVNYFRV